MINRLNTKEFHFVLNSRLKKKISTFSKLLKLNISKTIIFIIENISVLTVKIHLIYKDDKNAVENVNSDTHVHVYFPGDKKYIYNRLKSIHKDNNTYSIACKLRYLIKIFIRGVELYGFERFMHVLKNSEKRWQKRFKKKKIWNKKKEVRQLSIIPHLDIKYNLDYTVIQIKLLN